MLRPGQDPDLHHDVGHAADRGVQRGDAGAVVPAVGDHGDVRPQQVGVALDELGQVLGRALLLALDDDLDRDRAVAVGEERADRGRVDHDAALVVRGAASVHPPVLHDRLEGRRVPLVERPLRLDVVVRVEQDRGCALGSGDLAEDRGMAAVQLQEAGVRRRRLPRRMSRVASAEARTLAGS